MKKFYLLSIIAILLSSCEKEDTPVLASSGKKNLTELKKEFSNSNLDDEFIKDNLEVNWNDFQLDGTNENRLEFTTSLTSMLDGENQLHYKYNVMASKEQNDEWSFNLIKYITANRNNLIEISNWNTGNYTGTVHLLDLTGEVIEMRAFDNGEIVSRVKGELIPNTDNVNTTKREPPMWDDPSDSGDI